MLNIENEVTMDNNNSNSNDFIKQRSNSTSLLFKQVDNLNLDKLTYQLWNSASFSFSNASSNSSETTSCSTWKFHNQESTFPSTTVRNEGCKSNQSKLKANGSSNDEFDIDLGLEAGNDEDNEDVGSHLIFDGTCKTKTKTGDFDDEDEYRSLEETRISNTDEQLQVSPSSLGFEIDNIEPNTVNCNERNVNTNLLRHQYQQKQQQQMVSPASPITYNANSHQSQMCTIYLDMTYDDRVFFGVHNFLLLKYSLTESQCNVDFSAADNKVSIVGSLQNVSRMAKSFFLHSTFALQFEFYYYDKQVFYDFLQNRFKMTQQNYERLDVFISYRQDKANIVLFNFLTFRKYFIRIIQVMNDVKMQFEFYQLGRVLANITSTLQIPINGRRNDVNQNRGISNQYIERIERETKCQIKTLRYPECQHQYPFINVIINGSDIFAVIQARWFLTSRFNYELKFQIPTSETVRLVKAISSMSYDRSLIEVEISPGIINPNADSDPTMDSLKIVSIKSNEKNLDQIFALRQELSILMNNSQSKMPNQR